MIFLSLVNLYVVAKKYNCSYKLSRDNKILSSLIKKAWCTCTFLNHFREANEQHYAPCFYRIDFAVIPSYIELPWLSQGISFKSFLNSSWLKNM